MAEKIPNVLDVPANPRANRGRLPFREMVKAETPRGRAAFAKASAPENEKEES